MIIEFSSIELKYIKDFDNNLSALCIVCIVQSTCLLSNIMI